MDYLPDCWEDEEKMRYLFLEFRNKNVNVTAWQGKMDFWISAINKYCITKNRVIFDLNELRNAFKRKGRYPGPLLPVILEMERLKTILNSSDFISQSTNKGWVQWSYDMAVKKPLSVGWSTLRSVLFQKQEENQYIHLEILNDVTRKLLDRLHAETKSMFQFHEIMEYCKEYHVEDAAELILNQLEKNKSVQIILKDSEKFVQLCDDNPTKMNKSFEENISVIKMKNIQKKLENEIEHSQVLIEKYTNETKMYLKNGSRNLAKNALKRKKRMEEISLKKIQALENIQILIEKIEDAECNKLVAEAYRTGAEAYKRKVNSEDLDKLDDVMASVQEVLELHKDINDSISSSVDPNMDETSLELEEELAAIINQASGGAVSQTHELPEVPSHAIDDSDDLLKRFERLRSTSPLVEEKKKSMKTLAS